MFCSLRSPLHRCGVSRPRTHNCSLDGKVAASTAQTKNNACTELEKSALLSAAGVCLSHHGLPKRRQRRSVALHNHSVINLQTFSLETRTGKPHVARQYFSSHAHAGGVDEEQRDRPYRGIESSERWKNSRGDFPDCESARVAVAVCVCLYACLPAAAFLSSSFSAKRERHR